MPVNFVKVPNLMKYPANPTQAQLQQQIDEWKAIVKLGLIENAQILGYANAEHIRQRWNWGPWRGPGTPRPWWHEEEKAFIGTFCEQDAEGNWLTEHNPGPGGTIEGMQYTEIDVYNFARTYRDHFPIVPKLRAHHIGAEESARAVIVDGGPALSPPLAQSFGQMGNNLSTSWPRGIWLKVDQDDRSVMWAFRISEYMATYPLQITGTIPSTDPQAAMMRIKAVKVALASGKSTADMDTDIRALYVGK
jgi:hypothetical protein